MFTSGSFVGESTNWDNPFAIARLNAALPAWSVVRDPSQLGIVRIEIAKYHNLSGGEICESI